MTRPAAALALRPLEALGRHTLDVVQALGRFGTFLLEALAALLTPPFKPWAFLSRIVFIGYRSLLIIILTGAFTGMVLG
ncbi:MAG TPA: hypothetical protein DDZ42_04740, partial [Candidatus Rokubacteria bacterium]|nr:hypothetical protein [Candidatus Rokubacteria bacterium]